METISREDFEKRFGKSADTLFPSKDTEEKKPLSTRIAEGLGLGKAVDVFGTEIARATAPAETRGQIQPNKPGQLAGATAQTLATGLAPAITGGASLAGQVGAGVATGLAYDIGKDLAEGETPTPGVATVAGGLVPPALRGLSTMAKFGFNSAKNFLGKVAGGANEALQSPTVQGLAQKGQELTERIPRAIERGKTIAEESALKAEKIRQAPPLVAEAYKVDLPEKYINYSTQVDEPTRKALIKVLDIAEETPSTIGVKKNPTIVGGELASKQFEIIENQKKNIGEQIGAVVDTLSKRGAVDVLPAQRQMRQVLLDNGIKPDISGQLQFTGKFTPAERAKIQELYKLATEGGEQLTPRQVYDMDKLFSKLQREAKFDNVGNIMVDTPEGSRSLFGVFRDIYSNQLEAIAPDIKPLNQQYRQFSQLTDDIEDSIFKTPNFNVTKSTDEAEFAKVNLRRIFGESQSSPVYEAVADRMDEVARALGYTDASPKEIAAFAQEIRELYPESVPRTGFQGGFSRVLDIAEKVLGAGKADVEDQRKALRALLEATSQ